jgi:hypothetical protein
LARCLGVFAIYLGIGAGRHNDARAHPFGIGIGTSIMTTFDKREEGFEKQFAHDEELKFKADARRNRLLGAWVAEQIGLSGDTATAYAKQMVAAEFEGSGGAARKAAADLAAKGITVSEPQLQAKIVELTTLAIAQVKAGK